MDAAYRYLECLDEGHRSRLVEVNRPGYAALGDYLAAGRAIAFLGAGASAPLYPLWGGVITELINAARADLGEQAVMTCLEMADRNPDAVVELVRLRLGGTNFREVLRKLFRPRRDPITGRTWTSIQELVARCGFAGVVTTNYDPGIVNARMAVRPFVSGTGFSSWTDEDALDQWRIGDVFGGDELPVLYAHGHHNQPDAIVLATTEYRRAYAGKLSAALKSLADASHLVWIGFSFADQRIDSVLREVGEATGTILVPGQAPRHVALLPWNPAIDGTDGVEHDPEVIRNLMEIQYGCRTVLYPAPNGDHSALNVLLGEFAEERFPAARYDIAPPERIAREVLAVPQSARAGISNTGGRGLPVHWMHSAVPLDYFTGREEELGRLDRWAADPDVKLIGVTAWGGAGKTALVAEWLEHHQPPRQVQGVFGWSFYEDPSTERWANELLAWAEKTFGYQSGSVRRLSARVLDLMNRVPLLLVLDGLEIFQEAPVQRNFGRFLDDLLRVILSGLCRRDHAGLALLTSRFPFADLELFDGATARMLDVPPFTATEGAELLSRAGGDWLDEQERRNLVLAVDGHALALGALAAALRDRPPDSDLMGLRQDLAVAERTDVRVNRVLQFYSERLSVPDRLLVAVVSLFTRPVAVESVLALGDSQILGHPFAGWTATDVEATARGALSGLLTWQLDDTISAHPLVRDAFRPLVLTGDTALLASDVALADLPKQPVVSYDEAMRVTEMIELLLDAGQWKVADRLHYDFMDGGKGWARLPAARVGQRCTTAFVGTEQRLRTCREQLSAAHVARYLNWSGLWTMLSGDVMTAESSFQMALDYHRQEDDLVNQSLALQRLSGCLCYLGHPARAQEAAQQAIAPARADDFYTLLRNAITTLGAALDLAGNSGAADQRFTEADRLQVSYGSSSHIYSLGGTLWADFLIRTGRIAVARKLTEDNREICEVNRWNHGIARCDRILARCDLADGNVQDAGYRLDSSATTFRSGDFLAELALTLPDVAEQCRLAHDIEKAERLCKETILLAGPRHLIPSHAQALATRAKVLADKFAGGSEPFHKEQARDDADHALRLATRIRHLPWQELEALKAHAYIDFIEGHDCGWSRRAEKLHKILVPDNLSANPLAEFPGRVTNNL
jgi:tetratricopeptide (TPR) repeat protein